MGKKKKKKAKNVKRCIRNNIRRIKQDNILFPVLSEMSKASKYVYNTIIFCRKKYFEIHKLHLQQIVSQIDDIIDELSPMDRQLCYKYFKDKNDTKYMDLIIKNTHQSERKGLGLTKLDPSSLRTVKQKSISIVKRILSIHCLIIL